MEVAARVVFSKAIVTLSVAIVAWNAATCRWFQYLGLIDPRIIGDCLGSSH